MTERSICADGRLNRDKKVMPDPDAHFSKGRIREVCKTLLWTCLIVSVSSRLHSQKGVVRGAFWKPSFALPFLRSHYSLNIWRR